MSNQKKLNEKIKTFFKFFKIFLACSILYGYILLFFYFLSIQYIPLFDFNSLLLIVAYIAGAGILIIIGLGLIFIMPGAFLNMLILEYKEKEKEKLLTNIGTKFKFDWLIILCKDIFKSKKSLKNLFLFIFFILWSIIAIVFIFIISIQLNRLNILITFTLLTILYFATWYIGTAQTTKKFLFTIVTALIIFPLSTFLLCGKDDLIYKFPIKIFKLGQIPIELKIKKDYAQNICQMLYQKGINNEEIIKDGILKGELLSRFGSEYAIKISFHHNKSIIIPIPQEKIEGVIFIENKSH